MPARPVLVRRGREETGALGAAQPIGEHVRGDAAQVVGQVGEAPRAGGEGGDEQQRPAVADEVDGAAQIVVTSGAVACRASRVVLHRSQCSVTCNLQVTLQTAFEEDGMSEQDEQGAAVGAIGAVIGAVDAAAGGAVVSIGRDGRGSGFVVGQDRVLTSAHNLRDETVAVGFADGRSEQGRVHGVDADGDLAVLDVPTGEITALAFADATPGVGTPVVALARGGHRPRATLGFVSGVDRAFDGPRGRVVRGGFEHTAALARGSSGGPVLTAAGQVLGIDTHRAGDGFYLARTADAALQARIAELVAGTSPRRRSLGVAIAAPSVAAELRRAVGLGVRDGLLVRGVVDGGPAARAGIQVGDLLVRAGGVELADVEVLHDALAGAGETLAFELVRGADELSLTVTFDDVVPPAA